MVKELHKKMEKQETNSNNNTTRVTFINRETERDIKANNHLAVFNPYPVNIADPINAGREIRHLKEEVKRSKLRNNFQDKRQPPPSDMRQTRTFNGQTICQVCGYIGHSAATCR